MHRIYSRNKPQPVTPAQAACSWIGVCWRRVARAKGPESTMPPLYSSISARQWFYVLCLFFPVAFISNYRKEEIIYPDFPSQNSFPAEYNKGKKQSNLPTQFCSSIILQDKGHSHNSFFLLSERTHKPRFPKAPVVGSQVPPSRLLF